LRGRGRRRRSGRGKGKGGGRREGRRTEGAVHRKSLVGCTQGKRRDLVEGKRKEEGARGRGKNLNIPREE
jgi:hypothetical protein